MRSILQGLEVLAAHQRSQMWATPLSTVTATVRALKTITDIHASREEASTSIFDGALKALHRDRAAHAVRQSLLRSPSPGTPSSGFQYRTDPLLTGVADRLLDRLEDCKTKDFQRVAIVGGSALQVLDRLRGGRAGIQHATVVDTSRDMLKLIQEAAAADARSQPEAAWPSVACEIMDAEAELLPLEPGSMDLVISCLGLHWINDLPTMIAQCRFALKDDGLFLAAVFAGETLQEMRISCSLAQMERHGGVAPVVSPFAQVRDGGNLLTRAGLALPTVDMDEFVVRYAGGPTEVVSHLRSMGEVNAVLHRQKVQPRDTALAAGAIYNSMFGDPADGSVPATYQVMFLTGWAPHPSQQRPAARGSGTVSFQELADGLVSTGGAKGGSTGEGGEEDACAAPSTPPEPSGHKPPAA